MSCIDCREGRENPHYRMFNTGCLWCGARYAQRVRRSFELTLPARVDGQDMSRREWYEHVLKSWSESRWAHDRQRLRELADGEEIPFEPLERKHERNRKSGVRGAGSADGKGSASVLRGSEEGPDRARGGPQD